MSLKIETEKNPLLYMKTYNIKIFQELLRMELIFEQMFHIITAISNVGLYTERWCVSIGE